jgi:hypothetical protein
VDAALGLELEVCGAAELDPALLLSGSVEEFGVAVVALAQDAVASTQLSSRPVAARRAGRGEVNRVLMRDS